MKPLVKAGRYIYAIPFLIFGLFHFMNAGQMSGMLSGWPAPTLLVYISGVALIAAGISIITGIMARLASLLLALLLFIFIVSLHIPALVADPSAQSTMTNLLKDMALMGAALSYAGIFKK
jgi:uncharacterized membrane protein YphA (DoxX/SURF4 family)